MPLVRRSNYHLIKLFSYFCFLAQVELGLLHPKLILKNLHPIFRPLQSRYQFLAFLKIYCLIFALALTQLGYLDFSTEIEHRRSFCSFKFQDHTVLMNFLFEHLDQSFFTVLANFAERYL